MARLSRDGSARRARSASFIRRYSKDLFRRISFFILILLIAAQFAIVLAYASRPLITDEFYFVGKAKYLVTHHSFAPAPPAELGIESGRRWGTSDWRPQGYPIFLAVIGGDVLDDVDALRMRVTVVQFLAIAALLITTFVIASRGIRDDWRLIVAAFFFGASPWPFEFFASSAAISASVAS